MYSHLISGNLAAFCQELDVWTKHYWEFAEECMRLSELEFEGIERTVWDWRICDFNLFTSMDMANRGVYWVLMFGRDGSIDMNLS